MIIKTDNQSIFCQTLSMVALISELHRNDLLHSDFYHKKCFNGDANANNYKKILEASGLGNPATLQMELYALLVMPKEILGRDEEGNDNIQLCKIKDKFNSLFVTSVLSSAKIVENTYLDEQNKTIDKINFYRHIRNAVAHSRCTYDRRKGVDYITFEDRKETNEHIIIEMSTADAGTIVDRLQIWLMEYLNTSSDNE